MSTKHRQTLYLLVWYAVLLGHGFSDLRLEPLVGHSKYLWLDRLIQSQHYGFFQSTLPDSIIRLLPVRLSVVSNTAAIWGVMAIVVKECLHHALGKAMLGEILFCEDGQVVEWYKIGSHVSGNAGG